MAVKTFSSITAANKSPQTKQAASQNAPQGEATRSGNRAMAGSPSRKTNGNFGKGC